MVGPGLTFTACLQRREFRCIAATVMQASKLQCQATREKPFSPCIGQYTDQQECNGYMPKLHIDQYKDIRDIQTFSAL